MRLRHLTVDIWKGVCEDTAGKRSKGRESLHLAATFNRVGIALAVLRHCVPVNTCSGISPCDDRSTQERPFVHSVRDSKDSIQDDLTSVASLLQNARPSNGKFKGTKKKKRWPFWKNNSGVVLREHWWLLYKVNLNHCTSSRKSLTKSNKTEITWYEQLVRQLSQDQGAAAGVPPRQDSGWISPQIFRYIKTWHWKVGR